MDDLFGDDFPASPQSQPPTNPVSPVVEDSPEVVVAAPSPVVASPVVESPTSNGALPTIDAAQPKAQSEPRPSASVSPNGQSPTTHDEGSTFVSGSASLKERGAVKVKKQMQDIAARTAAQDAASIQKEKEIREAAAAYLKDLVTKRDQAINATKADHLKEQQEHERKMKELKTSGKLWDSVNLLVETKKPNAHSKNTEYMRNLIVELSTDKASAKA